MLVLLIEIYHEPRSKERNITYKYDFIKYKKTPKKTCLCKERTIIDNHLKTQASVNV